MAQAANVTSAIGTLITGANTKQSTNSYPSVHSKIASASLFLHDIGRAT
jgi:hypothetical protein